LAFYFAYLPIGKVFYSLKGVLSWVRRVNGIDPAAVDAVRTNRFKGSRAGTGQNLMCQTNPGFPPSKINVQHNTTVECNTRQLIPKTTI
jgi:hypothetical protein